MAEELLSSWLKLGLLPKIQDTLHIKPACYECLSVSGFVEVVNVSESINRDKQMRFQRIELSMMDKS